MQWIAGWNKRIKFEIDHSKIDEDLIDFPVLVNLDTTYSGVFNELGNNYKKISFMNPSTGEEYYCEVERWDYTEYSAQLWVKIPEISSNTNTKFYMLFDNNAPENSKYITKTYELQWCECGTYSKGVFGGYNNTATVVDDYIRLNVASTDNNGYYKVTNGVEDPYNFTVEFEHWSGGGNGADEVKFTFGSSDNHQVCINEYHDKIYLFIDGTEVQSVGCSYIDNSTWSWVRVVVTTSNNTTRIRAWFRGTKYLDYTELKPDNFDKTIQWFAWSGGVTNEHRVRSLIIKSIYNTNVWDNNYVGIYHLSQDPSNPGTCVEDSSPAYNNALPVLFQSSSLVNSISGKGVYFNGSSNYIICGTLDPYNYDNKITLEGLFSRDTSNTTNYIICKGNDATNNSYGMFHNGPGTNTGGMLFGTQSTLVTNSNSCEEANYTYSVYTIDNLGMTIYCADGSSNTATGDSYSTSTNEFRIGATTGSDPNTYYHHGIISEIRISNIIRPEAWLKVTKYSLYDQLFIKGDIETAPSTELDYANKIKILIPHYSENDDLYDFPVLVNICSSAGKNKADLTDVFEKLGSSVNRKKIAITDYTKVSQLYVEIERWSHADQSAQLWVKVPFISRTCDTELYLYYDPDKEDNYLMVGDTGSLAAQKVWDDNYVGIWHLSQDPSGGTNCILDSTYNKNHGTPGPGLDHSNLVDSIVGKAIHFDANNPDGTNNYISINSSRFNALPEITIEILYKPTKLPSKGISSTDWHNTHALISKFWDGTTRAFYIECREDDKIEFQNATNTNNNNDFRIKSDSTIVVGSTYHIAAMWDGVNIMLINSTQQQQTTSESGETTGSNNAPLYIGADYYNGSNYAPTDGDLREARISKIKRSNQWLKTTYKSNFDNLLIYDTHYSSWLQTYENGELRYWANRIKIEIDNSKVDEILEDFPILINISDESGQNSKDLSFIFEELINNDKKIAITSEDGITQLPIEIEYWDKIGIDFDNFTLSINVNSEGTYDTASILHCSVLLDDDAFVMMYRGYDSTNARILYCLSNDGINWYNYQLAVNIGSEGTYDTAHTCPGGFIKEDDGTYRMWYSGSDGTNYRVIHCTSNDCITWSNYQMVVDIGSEGTYDTSHIYKNCVIKENNGYTMWYSGYDGSNYRIIRCTSLDGLNWSNFKMVIDKGSKGSEDSTHVFGPSVIKTNDKYEMYYSGHDGYGWKYIIHCESDDGINWYNFSVCLKNKSEGNYDNSQILSPTAVKINDREYRLWYSADPGDSTWRELYCDSTSQKAALWTKVPLIKSCESSYIYLYYDNNKSDNINYVGNITSEPGQQVWSNNYSAVYHLSQPIESNKLTLYDSLNRIHGTPYYMDSSNVGETSIGRATKFNGSDEYIQVNDNKYLHIINNSSIEIIYYSYTDTDNRRNPLHKAYGGEFSFTKNTDGSLTHYYGTAGDDTTPYESSTPVPAGSDKIWLLATVTRNFDTKVVNGYTNDKLVYTRTPAFDELTTSTKPMLIGDGYTNNFLGWIKEIRLASTDRTASWVKANYHSNFDSLLIYKDSETYVPELPKNYYYYGHITERNIPVKRQVFLYRRSTGELIATTTSDSTGYYILKTPYNDEHFIVVLDDDSGIEYEALIKDRMLPNKED